ncbi:MAG: peptide-binding protein [Candidatus Wallbacteria bacterium]|nr:peptide-binding protein [Candidatus Wallbacteria bacterium]
MKNFEDCFILALAFFGLLFSGCSGNKIQPQNSGEPLQPAIVKSQGQTPGDDFALSPAYGDTIIESSMSDAVIINPLLNPDTSSGRIIGLVFNGLVRTNENLEFVPDLAETWEVLSQGLHLRFHLKKGVRWHDGVSFTAHDVLFTYQKVIDENTQTYDAESFTPVRSVEVEDEFTVSVYYDKPFAPALSAWTMGIIPRHLYQNEDINTSRYNLSPVGTGPFRFTVWTPQEQIILEANADYFLGRPYTDRFIFKTMPDPSMAFLSLKREEIDMLGLTPDQYDKQAHAPEFISRFNLYKYATMNYTYIGFNLLKPMFQDKRTRQALAMITDRQGIIDGILYGHGKLISGPFTPDHWAYDKSIQPYPFDPQKARELLSEAGWIDTNNDGVLDKDGIPFELTLTTNQGNEPRKLVANLIQQQWKEAGVRVKLSFVEWSVFMDVCDFRTFDAVILGWSLSAEPDHYGAWHSSQMPDKANGIVGDNFVSYSNPEVDRLIEEGRTTFDMEKRKAVYHRFHAILHDEQPYIFLYVADALSAVHNRIHGIKPAPAGIRYNFESWYVPKELRKY